MIVLLSPVAQTEFDGLPLTMKGRVLTSIARLEQWPKVSGVKWLTGEWKGSVRIRAGDWRIVFRPEPGKIVVERIAHRREVYE